MEHRETSKAQELVKWMLIGGALLGLVFVLIGLYGEPARADVQTVQTGAGISQYTEEVAVDWILLPGEEPIIIRHDDGSTWTVLPFGPSGSVE